MYNIIVWVILGLIVQVDEVDTVVQSVENVAEIVETVAEKVEEVADDIADQLPQDGKLHDAIRLVESIAKKTAIDAHIVDDLIEKVFYFYFNYFSLIYISN